jgi:hypothetical protein
MAGWRADAGRRLVRNCRAPDHMVMCHGKCSPHMVYCRCSLEGVDSSITTRLLRRAGKVSYGGHSRFLGCVYESPVRGRSSNREHVARQPGWAAGSEQRFTQAASSAWWAKALADVSERGEGKAVGIGQHWRDEGEDRLWLD